MCQTVTCGRSWRRPAPDARAGGVKQPLPLCTRVNGWSLPLHPYQVVAWAILLTMAGAGFAVFIPLLPGVWRDVTYGVSFRRACLQGEGAARVPQESLPLGYHQPAQLRLRTAGHTHSGPAHQLTLTHAPPTSSHRLRPHPLRPRLPAQAPTHWEGGRDGC
ncbi:uncharacterized protein LOC143673042 [Tamandua tetradactyla]|uniref:uncharacterized protein LOC143673042 n=1 Tax=Tamandua tetradactyla TaxID=48850 RepID=UPI0040541196